MPPYWTYYRRRRWNQRRRRPWFRARRPRKTFRRKWRRYSNRRYTRKVKKFKTFKKKKLKLTLKVFQPKSIRFCKIVGYKCLFQGSLKRSNHNYIQYIYSTVPPNYPGGGGWSLLVFNLSSLYEDFSHLQNYWTQTNNFLPLCRYLGCKFKFYQSTNTDYVVNYDTCWPMVDGIYTHANSSPLRMIQHKQKILIPSTQTKKRRKPYKVARIKPPSQMTNNWYFQSDLCNTNLVMITATAVNLTEPFATSTSLSNNITVTCLSPYIFQNTNFQHFSRTEGYWAKKYNEEKLFLYSSITPMPHTFTNAENVKQWFKQLTPLINTKEYRAGAMMSVIMQSGQDKMENWGNPFYFRYLHHEGTEPENTIYLINKNTSSMKTFIESITSTTLPTTLKITEVTTPQIYFLRYNPEKDTGQDNIIYLVKNDDDNTWEPPENNNLKFDGFPLFTLLWGWTDWVKKAKLITNLDVNSILVIKTKMFSETLPYYILIDKDFIEGEDPYTPNHTEQSNTPSYYNSQNWFPRLQYQEQNIQNICDTGPAAPKSIHEEYIQAYCKYTFYFKWGGCPKQLPKVIDPCSQSKWPTPHNFNGRPEITNPKESPETQIYSFDWTKDYVNKTAIERVGNYTKTDKPMFSITDSNNNPQAITTQTKETQKTQEKKNYQQLLQQLKQQQMVLNLKLQLKDKLCQ